MQFQELGCLELLSLEESVDDFIVLGHVFMGVERPEVCPVETLFLLSWSIWTERRAW